MILLVLVDASLKFKGVKKTEQILRNLSSNIQEKKDENNNLSTVLITGKMVGIASKYYQEATCLRRSLVLWYLLRKQGIKSKLCVGVRKEKQNFESHAWIEYLGIPINENESISQKFTVITTTTD